MQMNPPLQGRRAKSQLPAQSGTRGQLWESADSHQPHLGCRRGKETRWRRSVHHAMINEGKMINRGKTCRVSPPVSKPSLPLLFCHSWERKSSSRSGNDAGTPPPELSAVLRAPSGTQEVAEGLCSPSHPCRTARGCWQQQEPGLHPPSTEMLTGYERREEGEQ